MSRLTARPHVALTVPPTAFYRKDLPANAADLGQTTYAATLDQLGRKDEAEKSYLEGIEIYKSAKPSDDMTVAIYYDNLGGLYFKELKLAQAETFKRKALGILQSRLRATHPEVTISVCNLAAVLVAEEKDSEARP